MRKGQSKRSAEAHIFVCRSSREECHSREQFDVQAAFATTKAAHASPVALSVSSAASGLGLAKALWHFVSC